VDQMNARLPAKLRWGARIAWLTEPFSCESWMPNVNLKVREWVVLAL